MPACSSETVERVRDFWIISALLIGSGVTQLEAYRY